MDELRLCRGAMTISVHQPEPYLIRFERPEDCAVERAKGRFTRRGIDICVGPWRSLTHAFGMRIFYRVRLCIDGIPTHAWTPEIVERVIGSKCALQYIITDLVQLHDTRHIDLWAWAEDPSTISKVVWLSFTQRSSAAPPTVLVSDEPPTPWVNGARFQVFIHMPTVEDYSAAESNP